MHVPLIDPELRTVSIYGKDYRTLTLIAKKNGLLNNNGKASIRDAVNFLVTEYAKLTKEMKKK